MLDCKICNYYKKANVDTRTNNACVCEMTGFEFKKEFMPVIENWLDYKKDRKEELIQKIIFNEEN